MWFNNLINNPLVETLNDRKNDPVTDVQEHEEVTLWCIGGLGFVFYTNQGHLYTGPDYRDLSQCFRISGHSNRKDNINFMTSNASGSLVCLMTQKRVVYMFQSPKDANAINAFELTAIRFKNKPTHDQFVSLSLGDNYLIAMTHRGIIYQWQSNKKVNYDSEKHIYTVSPCNIIEIAHDNLGIQIDTSQSQPFIYTENGQVILL